MISRLDSLSSDDIQFNAAGIDLDTPTPRAQRRSDPFGINILCQRKLSGSTERFALPFDPWLSEETFVSSPMVDNNKIFSDSPAEFSQTLTKHYQAGHNVNVKPTSNDIKIFADQRNELQELNLATREIRSKSLSPGLSQRTPTRTLDEQRSKIKENETSECPINDQSTSTTIIRKRQQSELTLEEKQAGNKKARKRKLRSTKAQPYPPAPPLPQLSIISQSLPFSLALPRLATNKSLDEVGSDSAIVDMGNVDCDDLRRRLKNVLQSKRMTQKSLIQKLGVSRCSFRKFMNVTGMQEGLGSVMCTAALTFCAQGYLVDSHSTNFKKTDNDQELETKQSDVFVTDAHQQDSKLRDQALDNLEDIRQLVTEVRALRIPHSILPHERTALTSIKTNQSCELLLDQDKSLLPTNLMKFTELNTPSVLVFDDCDTVRQKLTKLSQDFNIALSLLSQQLGISNSEAQEFMKRTGMHEGKYWCDLVELIFN
jgi:transcriptional regulator with XRE-family HTH domain